MTLVLRRGFLALGAVASATLAAPRIAKAQSMATLADTMAGDNRFERFLDVITRASAVEDFRQPAPMTVFAPVNQAFMGAPQGLLQELLGSSGNAGNNQDNVDRTRVLALIRNHVVPGSITTSELGGANRRLRTANGGDIELSGTGTEMTIRNPAPAQQLGAFGAAGAQAGLPAQILGSPVRATNGLLYPISQLVWP